MRPEVNAGPIRRRRRPLNVGVDIGSRGVGEASGVAVALGLGDAATEGDGDGDGCCAATLTKQTTNNDIESNARAHAEVVIKGFPFFWLCIETIRTRGSNRSVLYQLFTKMLMQEINCALPRIDSGIFVINLGTRIVEESVIRSRIDDCIKRFSQSF